MYNLYFSPNSLNLKNINIFQNKTIVISLPTNFDIQVFPSRITYMLCQTGFETGSFRRQITTTVEDTVRPIK